MGIWLIVTIWMLTAGVFVLAICSAAARPIPQPATTDIKEQKSMNSKFEIQAPHTIKLSRVAMLAILFAVLTTSCTTTNGSHPFSGGSNEPVKGATLLINHSR
jgi:hypothetical protein